MRLERFIAVFAVFPHFTAEGVAVDNTEENGSLRRIYQPDLLDKHGKPETELDYSWHYRLFNTKITGTEIAVGDIVNIRWRKRDAWNDWIQIGYYRGPSDEVDFGEKFASSEESIKSENNEFPWAHREQDIGHIFRENLRMNVNESGHITVMVVSQQYALGQWRKLYARPCVAKLDDKYSRFYLDIKIRRVSLNDWSFSANGKKIKLCKGYKHKEPSVYPVNALVVNRMELPDFTDPHQAMDEYHIHQGAYPSPYTINFKPGGFCVGNSILFYGTMKSPEILFVVDEEDKERWKLSINENWVQFFDGPELFYQERGFPVLKSSEMPEIYIEHLRNNHGGYALLVTANQFYKNLHQDGASTTYGKLSDTSIVIQNIPWNDEIKRVIIRSSKKEDEVSELLFVRATNDADLNTPPP